MTYICKTCGEAHEALPALGFKGPDYADLVPMLERKERVRIDDELCAVDEEHFFIRASLSIPIHEQKDDLNFSVWVSLSQEHFMSYIENFNSPAIGPYFGWLANNFSYKDEPTLNMESMVYFQSGGLRPVVKLKESEHPLVNAQRNGISLDEAWEVAHRSTG